MLQARHKLEVYATASETINQQATGWTQQVDKHLT